MEAVVGVVYAIGAILVYSAIMKLLQRRENYQNHLEMTEYRKKTNLFWGSSPEFDDQRTKK